MLRYLLVLCIFNRISLLNCMQRPALEGTYPSTSQGELSKPVLFKLEEEHYKDYKVNRATYDTWPELGAVIKFKIRICQHFLLNLNVLNDVRKIVATPFKLSLFYPLQNYSSSFIKGLKCTEPRNLLSSVAKEIVISRSPRIACVLLLLPFKRNAFDHASDNYHISGEYCDPEYKQQSIAATKESINEQGISGQGNRGLNIPKVKLNREVNEEVDPRPRVIIQREKNKEKIINEDELEIIDEVESSEMDKRRLRNLATPKRERDDYTKQPKKRIYLE